MVTNDTLELHCVKIPENHIVIDFDVKDENGNNSAESSKSGAGVHLHYIYTDGLSGLGFADCQKKETESVSRNR